MAGAPYAEDGCSEPICLVYRPGIRIANAEKGGHAQCGCGERGPHVWSKQQRQQWHREHKFLVSMEEIAANPEFHRAQVGDIEIRLG